MSAKRFALACSAVGVLMSASPAQSPSPEPLPAPRPVAEPRQVVVQATCYEMPVELIDAIGSALNDRATPNGTGPGGWTLTPREARLLEILLRAARHAPGYDVLSRPQLTLTDEQTGIFQVGQQSPIITGLRVESRNGADVYTAQVTKAEVGITLRITPKLAADGRSATLRTEFQYRTMSPAKLPVVPVGFVDDAGNVRRGPTAEAFQVGLGLEERTTRMNVALQFGDTALVYSEVAGDGRKPTRVVLRLTPHAVGSQPTPAANPCAEEQVSPPRAVPPPALP